MYADEYVDIRMDLPAGTYTFYLEAESGNPNLFIFQNSVSESNVIGMSVNIGDDELTGNLSAGTYIVRVGMDTCYNFFSPCNASLFLNKAGDPDFAASISYDGGGTIPTSGSDAEYCESHEYRGPAGNCIPDPTFRQRF